MTKRTSPSIFSAAAAVAVLAVASTTPTTTTTTSCVDAFTSPAAFVVGGTRSNPAASSSSWSVLSVATGEGEETSAVFVPPTDADDDDDSADGAEIGLDAVEMLGKGAAKVCVQIVCGGRLSVISLCPSVDHFNPWTTRHGMQFGMDGNNFMG
jgi:hypothetical protein